ncbi:MAG TPA: Maf family protein [Nitrospira sp.]|nr:Maf family protein [Nitrospira sp.]
MRVILASTSPRRQELFALLGVPFEVRPPAFEERVVSGRSGKELVASFARGKAYSVAKDNPDAVVLGSDTLIELDGEVMGKPVDLIEARAMLRRVAGREHLVHTAVTLSCLARLIETTQVSTACVRMKPFSVEEHERYLATGDSLGKAGAYSIQGPGGELVESVDGDFLSVVGFPLRLVAMFLTQAGVTVPVDIDRLYATMPYGNWRRFQSPSGSCQGPIAKG